MRPSSKAYDAKSSNELVPARHRIHAVNTCKFFHGIDYVLDVVGTIGPNDVDVIVGIRKFQKLRAMEPYGNWSIFVVELFYIGQE